MKITDKYVLFWGNTCFSQWHPSKFVVNDIEYNCAEQYMMAEKARLFNDSITESKIMSSKNPRDQKKLGRQVSNFDADIWSGKAKEIVYKGNMHKFNQNPAFKKELMDTNNLILVEASPYDKIWGIGLSEDDDRCLNKDTWQGLNWLGEVLTKLRNDFSSGTFNKE